MLTGKVRWPSLTTVTSKAPCLNECGVVAKAGRAPAASVAADEASKVRRVSIMAPQ